ncbi:hypothetical protein Tco_0251983 [Tanacetum coccineum]
MLEKHLYDSWKSRMELYMLNRPHGRMILASVEKGPLVWPSITVDGVTMLKEYIEADSSLKPIQADCDNQAINIILQGLPTEIYALVSQHRVAKDLWEKIKLLMQGTKRVVTNEYYLRFTLLLNDMNIYKMPLEQFQVNTKFLNTLPDEWSKFVTDVKLVKDLHSYQCDQLMLTYNKHERHANEVCLMHERKLFDPLALVASHQLPPSTYQSHLHTLPNSQLQHHVSPYPIIHTNNWKCSPTVQHQQSEFSQPDSGLIVPVFQKGDDPIDAINHMMSFLTAVVTSRGMNKLLYVCRGTHWKIHTGASEATQGNNDCSSVTLQRGWSYWPSIQVDIVTEDEIAFLADPGPPNNSNLQIPRDALHANLSRNAQMHSLRKIRELKSKPKLYDGNVILKMDTIVIPDSDETLMLCEESRSKMLLKEQDPMVVKNKSNTKPINYAALNNDYNKRIVHNLISIVEHAFWKATSVQPLEPMLRSNNRQS